MKTDNLDLTINNKQSQKSAEESGLNKPITVKFLLSFTIPTILSFVLQSTFGIIDGVFASRGISVEALSAVNFVMPFITFTLAIASMLSIGGCALIAKKKGKGLFQEARENFTLLSVVTFISSLIIMVISWILRDPLLNLLGTDMHVFDLTLEYLQPLILMMPFFIVGMFMIQFLIAEGRPVLGMIVSISGAVVSTSLNALMLFVFDMGVMGLALATGIGYSVPAIIGFIYFTFNRKGTLYFVRPKWDIRALGRSSINGISEMITMMAATVTTIVMNNVLVRIVGFEGVAAAGIVMGLQAVFSSLYFGYATGLAPVVSYNFGKEKHDNLRKLYKKSLVVVASLAIIALIGTVISADLLVRIYVPEGTPMHAMTVRGLRIATVGYLFMSFNVFVTAWFTAFNDGLVSGVMSFMRTMVFSLILLVTLPNIWDLTGVWIALPLAEVLSIILTIFFLIKLGKKYNYAQTKIVEQFEKREYKNNLHKKILASEAQYQRSKKTYNIDDVAARMKNNIKEKANI